MDQKDLKLFEGTAEYYAKYRVGYSPEFFEEVARRFNLDGKGRLLDLGCGTGQLAIPLAKHFEEVIGIDPEQGMLDEAEKQAEAAGVQNARWLCGTAEGIGSDLGIFKLTVMGASFHWMQQAEVLEKVHALTEKGGGVAIVYDSSGSWALKDDKIEPWKIAARTTLKKYLGEKRRAGNSFYQAPEKDHDDLLDESSFSNYEEWSQEYKRIWTTESILGFLYSTSFASRQLFGDKLAEFEAELKSELLKIKPDGVFVEKACFDALFAKKH